MWDASGKTPGCNALDECWQELTASTCAESKKRTPPSLITCPGAQHSSLVLTCLHFHQVEFQMAREENCRLTVELQEAKSRQEEQGAQVQQLKEKVAHLKGSLAQAQQRVVSDRKSESSRVV